MHLISFKGNKKPKKPRFHFVKLTFEFKKSAHHTNEKTHYLYYPRFHYLLTPGL